jgi:hypothetical protein
VDKNIRGASMISISRGRSAVWIAPKAAKRNFWRMTSVAALLGFQVLAASQGIGETLLPSSALPPPPGTLDCSDSTQIGKYKHCNMVPPTLALTDEQFSTLSTGPNAVVKAGGCTTIGNFHWCPLAPPAALELTKEQYDALSKPPAN